MNTISRYHFINKMTPGQILLSFYVLAIILSTVLLSLPVAHRESVDLRFVDILFTAVSGISVTGLSTIDISAALSTTGIIILALIMQVGAVGVMAMGTFIWLLLGKKIGLKERRLIMTDQNQTSFQGMVKLIKGIVVLMLVIELIGILLLGTYLLQYYPAKDAYLQGFFGTISALSNGGFDITGQSLMLFSHDYFIQSFNIVLIILGAIGFPVWIEVKEYLFAKADQRNVFRFTLFTKLTSTTFFVLVVVGAIFIFLFDIGGFFAGKSWHESFFYALFQSVTTRSGGLATLDVNQLSDTNHLFMSMLMFIGASPSSAGGGIRTTTFALALIFVITYMRGGKSIRIFHREIYQEDLSKAVAVTLVAFALVFFSVMIMTLVEPFTIDQLLFEVTSAFGTVGLSFGITGDLTTFSKLILMFLMFIGRVGVITILLLFVNKNKKQNYHLPKEKIIIG